MAKTNSQGYFCDIACGFQRDCPIAFLKGCASARKPLEENTEYPEVSFPKHNETCEEKSSFLGNGENTDKKWYEKDTDEWDEDDRYEALEDLYNTYH